MLVCLYAIGDIDRMRAGFQALVQVMKMLN
jgi:hypothetical protein